MRQITKCFDPKISSLYQEAAALETLTSRVKKHLNAGSKQKERLPCVVSRFHQGEMTISVSDPVWATRLRYELPSLRDKLRQEGLHHLSTIRVNIAPANQGCDVKKKKRKAPKLSAQAKKTISSSADSCTYEPLKVALKRLGRSQASAKTPSG